VLTLATAYDYDRLIKALLLPAPLAQRPITQIDDGDINRFLGELMKRKGLNGQLIGPRRINMIIARLRTIFSTAKRRKLIPEDPMVFVKNLREAKAEVDPFTLEEAERLIDAATGQDRTLVSVLIFCGLRPNEALALRWEDIDFDREQIRIRRSIHRFAGVGLPKNTSSEREVDMLSLVVDGLQEQRARTQLRGDLVFLNETGGPLDLTNFRERNWRRILVKASLRRRTVYQCRHTYAALQLSRGENPQYVAHQMGHTNLEMIIRHYARWSRRPERVGTLADQLSAKFPSKKPEISLKMAVAGASSVLGASRSSSQVVDSAGRKAGAGDRGRTGDVQLGKTMGTDLDGVFFGAREALPHLLKTKGSIVNLSSTSGLGGDWGMSAYNAAKGAVTNFTRALALEYGSRGVRINAVAPSFTSTEATAFLEKNEAVKAAFLDRLPIGREATPDDIAGVIAFLASEDAVFVNGVILSVDGGLHASNGQPNFLKLLGQG